MMRCDVASVNEMEFRMLGAHRRIISMIAMTAMKNGSGHALICAL